ncbi:MAG: 5-(carboxyamino)imidazole ribonucleotide synthase [Flavipsychrobacter sp.]
MIASNKKIGILGGGQLGAMLLKSAIDFGVDIAVLDKSKEVNSAKYTANFTIGDTLNYDDVYNFGKGLDIITIEMEAVNVAALKALEKEGVKIFPSPNTIEIIQDKYHQKTFLQDHNIPVAKGWSVEGLEEIKEHIAALPLCLKKRRDGYDGNGVMMLRSEQDVAEAFVQPSVLEECVDIKHEISVIVARNEQGNIVCFDPVMMVFDPEKYLLDYQLAPASIPEELYNKTQELATQVAKAIELVGVLAVEMFVSKDGALLVNELAPRPHNSGHHTIEAATTSQYEQLLRAITGSPLGSTTLNMKSVLVNILEPNEKDREKVYESLNNLLGMERVHLHWYGKKPSKEGRKMGHIVVTDEDIDAAMLKAETIRKMIKTK